MPFRLIEYSICFNQYLGYFNSLYTILAPSYNSFQIYIHVLSTNKYTTNLIYYMASNMKDILHLLLNIVFTNLNIQKSPYNQ